MPQSFPINKVTNFDAIEFWWLQVESNHWRTDFQSVALPTELWSRFVWSKLKFVRQIAIGRFIIKVTNFDAIKLGGRCEIRTHGPFLIDDFQGRCNNPLCQSSVLWWNVLDSNQLTHYRSRFYRPLQSPMLLTFHCGLRERIRTFDPLIPNQVLCQTELLGEKITGGMYWIRTNDLLLVREILYQLS